MIDTKTLITDYLRTLSGQPKTSAAVARYVADEGLRRHIADVEAAFPRYEISADDLLCEGNKVVVRGTFHGVHMGPFAGVPPTQCRVSAGLIIIYEIVQDRIVNHWMQFDLFSLVRQLEAAASGMAGVTA